MIDDRGLCVCGHPASDHDHGIDCGRCEDCYEFTDQNDLVPQPPGYETGGRDAA